MTAKLRALLVVYLKDCFAYPAATFIWVLADAQAAIVLPAVWLAAGSATVAGMTHPELVAYYLCSMTLSQFIVCHLMWDMAWDIREGVFSAHLVRPVSYFWSTVARNMAWRLTKLALFLPLLGIAALAYGGLGKTPLNLGASFWVSVLLAHALSFVVAYCLSMVTLWTTEFMSIFRLYYVPELFLSGRLVPLGALPDWAQSLAGVTPFRYTVAFPLDVLLGKLGGREILIGLAAQSAWTLGFLALGAALFSSGRRVYAGVGM